MMRLLDYRWVCWWMFSELPYRRAYKYRWITQDSSMSKKKGKGKGGKGC